MSDFLQIQNLTAGYNDAVVLNNLSVTVERGQSLAILGRNGVGKTTLLETIMGNTTVKRGSIRWLGEDITHLRSAERARRGIGWVPQEREVFPSLTVQENLEVIARGTHWTRERVYGLFPRLRERAANYGGQLSGGEQQMLAIGRALMTNPQLLLLDEPMEGLAPIIVEELSEAVRRMCAEEGLTAIIVEQHPVLALSMSQHAIVLERGVVSYAGSSAELAADTERLDQLLGVGRRPPPTR
ncbi:MAG: ABC transporter ATP-binding protein [Pigmentiphaga sp.]|uniref:ABC transporter ATP-binding protein n=1 Tax=Pigmentiphaga sp. TaxID=1977564 RepID=UPI0029A95DA0|nr:ABC transporter ATP-binding protein [Pigmentiphaga sp.]MDX3906050.1 ABC transporter ATP-binding protein [Pigmentiphaga sp.]